MRTRDDEWSRALQRGIESGAPDYVAWGGQAAGTPRGAFTIKVLAA